jgi:uncharacterized protein (UPF0548 family)
MPPEERTSDVKAAIDEGIAILEKAAQSIMCWRARTDASLVRLGSKSCVAGVPFISWPPIVMNREYQSTRNSETSLAPIIEVPDTSPWCSASALAR